jgi:acetyltransferase-like isoleucine patch superfamily enzyme
VHLLSGARIHGTADPTRPIRQQEGEVTHITIGAASWIGAGAVVMADVGRDSIVGAGAVVTKPIPESVIAAGVPARVIRARAG